MPAFAPGVGVKVLSDFEVASRLNFPDAFEVLQAAFEQLGRGEAAVLPRSRAVLAGTDGAALMVSAMGAMLPQVLGTKVYATRNGQFDFVISLFDTATGKTLGSLQANALTEVRTAACTAVAVRSLAHPEARTAAIFGSGVQAWAHARALAALGRFDALWVAARTDGEAVAQRWSEALALPVRAVSPREAAAAPVVLTCTRATEPLFDGNWVQPGALVAAIGSSKPVAREVDDRLIERARWVLVEHEGCARTEAGDLVRAAAGVLRPDRVVELGQWLVTPRAREAEDIVLYKSVGIGLADVALAWHALQRD
ncbi:ornithine cyclodeaminase family protein [Inhella gelatinilytica]|uniref:Ornithine cyclodeaminase family protein n=1 Tax=Inhella gelatinilytica TaxID=2795030 RepID=A0A931NDV5_9BURK|nr:ornithine cyclodeaminase family protein [Inhella gelatinilytica]MBH9552635.1 ornithine cyclodeaminase family protein [Inhella gelatinilytica]